MSKPRSASMSSLSFLDISQQAGVPRAREIQALQHITSKKRKDKMSRKCRLIFPRCIMQSSYYAVLALALGSIVIVNATDEEEEKKCK
jgi:uncharacterized membrane protein